MQDVVVLPTFDRPEFLWLCLDHIAACAEHKELDIRVHVDAHHHHQPPMSDILEVLEHFPQLHTSLHVRRTHDYAGNSYNLLMGYKDAYESGSTLVFLIEDDVMVKSNFFTWHRLVQAERWPVVSIGAPRPAHGVYASIGVCFSRSLLSLLLPHCQHAYFSDMREYCQREFGKSPFDCEQDGLIARVLMGNTVIWADEPVCQHVGWYGYHRMHSQRPTGGLEKRYATIKHVLSNPSVLRRWVKDFDDIAPLESPCN